MGLGTFVVMSVLAVVHVLLSSISLLEDNPSLKVIGQADFFLDKDDTLRAPPSEEAFQRVNLPDVWIERIPEKTGTGWYRMQFEVAESDNIRSMFISRLGLNANFYLDGQRVGGYGTLRGERVIRPWNRPHMASFPGVRLAPGPHTLVIELDGMVSHYTGLGRVYLGPEDDLLRFFNERMFVQNTMALVSSGLCIAGFIGLLLIWSQLNYNKSILCLILIISLMGVWMSGFSTHEFPFDQKEYARFMYLIHFVMLGLMYQLILLCRPTPSKRGSILLWTLVVMLLIPVAISDIVTLLRLMLIETAIFASATIPFLYHCLKKGRFSFEVVSATFLFLLDLGHVTNDYIVLTTASRFEEALVGQYMGLILLSYAGFYLTLNFIEAFDIRNKNNLHLKSELEKNELQLKQQYEKLALIERARFQQEERETLMADMHDGIGSQLVSTVAALRIKPMDQQEVVAVLQHCIDDLRLTIDSLEPTHQDILTLLGNFRYRIESRLRIMGIQLRWDVNDIPDLAYLNPRTSLQFLRIVQEAFANIVKHSHCKEIDLKVAFKADHIEVRIEDDGVGAEADGSGTPTGKGLKNMSRRAEQMGLKFSAGNRTDKQGFEVVIALPITQ